MKSIALSILGEPGPHSVHKGSADLPPSRQPPRPRPAPSRARTCPTRRRRRCWHRCRDGAAWTPGRDVLHGTNGDGDLPDHENTNGHGPVVWSCPFVTQPTNFARSASVFPLSADAPPRDKDFFAAARLRRVRPATCGVTRHNPPPTCPPSRRPPRTGPARSIGRIGPTRRRMCRWR